MRRQGLGLTNHYSLAFTYDCIARSQVAYHDSRACGGFEYDEAEHMSNSMLTRMF